MNFSEVYPEALYLRPSLNIDFYNTFKSSFYQSLAFNLNSDFGILLSAILDILLINNWAKLSSSSGLYKVLELIDKGSRLIKSLSNWSQFAFFVLYYRGSLFNKLLEFKRIVNSIPE